MEDTHGQKETLIELRTQTYDQLKQFISNLSHTEHAAVGTPDEWSIKDAMVHVASWDERRGINLQAIARGEAPTDWGDYNEVNAREFEVYKNDDWETVEKLLDRSQEAMLAGLEGLDEETLSRNDVLPGDQGRSMWGRIAGSNIMHPMLHMTDYLAKNERANEALEIVLSLSDLLAELDENDEWQGLLLYNKACYQALAGNTEIAIELLGGALPLNPGLVEWSKEDSDLNSLREEVAYKALYEDG